MKKKIVIVSTYPENGSKNIGDRLITNKLKAVVSSFGDYDFSIIWRAAPWDSVKEEILSCDHIFFACLAIRRNMHLNEYPYFEKIIDSGVPFSIISAGTNLGVNYLNTVFDDTSKASVLLLKRANESAVVSTTRGYLSQEFCRNQKLDHFNFSGDIAFFDNSFHNKKFVKNLPIKKIVVSDPHRSQIYENVFDRLVSGLKSDFPDSELVVAMHGVNPEIEFYCNENGIDFIDIYKFPDSGLNIYDSADLHVGFRVHAHVSALTRRKYSYLLEQDGRGCDYGLTIERKISVPCYPSLYSKLTVKALIKRLLGKNLPISGPVSISPAEQLLAIINADRQQGFEKFVGLERQIEQFHDLTRQAVGQALGEPS